MMQFIFVGVLLGVLLEALVRASAWLAQERRKDKIARQKREAEAARLRAQEERLARKQLFWRNLKEISL